MPTLPRPPLPHLPMRRLPLPRAALPQLSLPRPSVPRPSVPRPSLPRPSSLLASLTGTTTGALADAYGFLAGAASVVRRGAGSVVPEAPPIGSNPKRRYSSSSSRSLRRE